MSSPPLHPAEIPLFAQRLRPHRSMTRAQMRGLLCVVAAVGVATSLPFVIMGAWPVAGFFGLDILLVYAGFSASFRSARAYEDISVTPLELFVQKVSAKGKVLEWRFNPVWVRLKRYEHEEFGTQRVDVVSRGGSVEVAGFLGPDAKGRFADGLNAALQEARRGVRYS